MSAEHLLFTKPEGLQCEAKFKSALGVQILCFDPASYIYGPECEAESGKLMYLCNAHALRIRDWMSANAFNPVECPTHGRIGMVKDYLILKRMETVT